MKPEAAAELAVAAEDYRDGGCVGELLDFYDEQVAAVDADVRRVAEDLQRALTQHKRRLDQEHHAALEHEHAERRLAQARIRAEDAADNLRATCLRSGVKTDWID